MSSYMTSTKNIQKLNQRELDMNIFDHKLSWHNDYKDSAYIFIGGLSFDLTEGDIICVFSQYGEILYINLVRDLKTGKSKGFCFLAYMDQKSTILAVDNLNGISLAGKIIKVDHVSDYRPPKTGKKDEFGNDIFQKPVACYPVGQSNNSDTNEANDNDNLKYDNTYDEYSKSYSKNSNKNNSKMDSRPDKRFHEKRSRHDSNSSDTNKKHIHRRRRHDSNSSETDKKSSRRYRNDSNSIERNKKYSSKRHRHESDSSDTDKKRDYRQRRHDSDSSDRNKKHIHRRRRHYSNSSETDKKSNRR